MRVEIHTLGCKVNQYESEAMMSMLEEEGFFRAKKGEKADILIVNSCTVTSTSDSKVRKTFHRIKRENPAALTVLTGCMPQAFPEIAAEFPEADIIIGTKNRNRLPEHIMNYLSSRQQIVDIAPHESGEAFEKMVVKAFGERTRAFLKIQDGCNRFCAYCIIPYARGRVRSKSLAEIEPEIRELAENGHCEIVLTGINLSAYGQDIGAELCDAVEVACKAEEVKRVRLGSLEPERLSDSVIARLAAQKKFCPQFHLSLQSGCDETLERMNRHYTAAEYKKTVEKLRKAFDNPAITTDIMVGFPGETDEEFAKSLRFAEEVGFAKVHVFAYSRRAGTKAYDAPNQVDERIKTLRSKQMIEATEATQRMFCENMTGRIEEVLLERAIGENSYEGYTMNYTPVRVNSARNLQGILLKVKITKAEKEFCHGEIQENAE